METEMVAARAAGRRGQAANRRDKDVAGPIRQSVCKKFKILSDWRGNC
jgi:hypothetical protein